MRVLCRFAAKSNSCAVVLSQAPFNANTRAAGIEESYALIPVDGVLVQWANEIVCMTKQHESMLLESFPEAAAKVIVLDIPDNFAYRDPVLMKLIAAQYQLKSQSKA